MRPLKKNDSSTCQQSFYFSLDSLVGNDILEKILKSPTVFLLTPRFRRFLSIQQFIHNAFIYGLHGAQKDGESRLPVSLYNKLTFDVTWSMPTLCPLLSRIFDADFWLFQRITYKSSNRLSIGIEWRHSKMCDPCVFDHSHHLLWELQKRLKYWSHDMYCVLPRVESVEKMDKNMGPRVID